MELRGAFSEAYLSSSDWAFLAHIPTCTSTNKTDANL